MYLTQTPGMGCRFLYNYRPFAGRWQKEHHRNSELWSTKPAVVPILNIQLLLEKQKMPLEFAELRNQK